MPRSFRFLLILGLPLALLAWGASRYAHQALGEWAEKELLEGKLGFSDSPDLKAGMGWAF
ncbi:MAG: hypothetical protein HY509_01405 [Acidobacteria bacterium]|nr:hypothetical protein [Acidobacteriota bacterium]